MDRTMQLLVQKTEIQGKFPYDSPSGSLRIRVQYDTGHVLLVGAQKSQNVDFWFFAVGTAFVLSGLLMTFDSTFGRFFPEIAYKFSTKRSRQVRQIIMALYLPGISLQDFCFVLGFCTQIVHSDELWQVQNLYHE